METGTRRTPTGQRLGELLEVDAPAQPPRPGPTATPGGSAETTDPILTVDHVAPAVCMVDVRIKLQEHVEPREVRLRWIYETVDGDPAVPPLPGEWHLVVWGPTAVMSPPAEDED